MINVIINYYTTDRRNLVDIVGQEGKFCSLLHSHPTADRWILKDLTRFRTKNLLIVLTEIIELFQPAVKHILPNP